MYTELINHHISDPEQHLKVFDKNTIYLPPKKIGKNNPKEDEIMVDNAARQGIISILFYSKPLSSDLFGFLLVQKYCTYNYCRTEYKN